MNTVEKYDIYEITKEGTQISDKHTVCENKIFETIIHYNPKQMAPHTPHHYTITTPYATRLHHYRKCDITSTIPHSLTTTNT
jgi:hypothetical protein